MKQAKAWINKQPCGPTKKEVFLDYCIDAFNGKEVGFNSYEKAQDWLDSLRRDYYVGMGI